MRPDPEMPMRFENYSFGLIRIEGVVYEHDILIDRGSSKRKEEARPKVRDDFAHTPLSLQDKIPWKCKRLVIGIGAYGRSPVMNEA